MDKYIYDENNGLWYERCGGYYLPCLTIPEQKNVGKWGQKYRAYLRKHKREVYNAFQFDGTLDDHVAEIDRQAGEMFERLVEQIAARQGVTEQLKANDQMAWVSAMNHVRSIAEEIVLSDLIYYFGSVPQFYNTFDGITAWLNGVVMTNRKVAVSRHTSVSKAIRAMQFGADLMVFPEDVWNKSPNALILDLWPGIYRIACETGAKVVPVVHYIRDCTNREKNNPIHTVVDDPISINNLSERAALELIRDVLATWFYLMMEIYGKSTREDVLEGYDTISL